MRVRSIRLAAAIGGHAAGAAAALVALLVLGMPGTAHANTCSWSVRL